MKKLLISSLISLFILSQGYCANEWRKGTGYGAGGGGGGNGADGGAGSAGFVLVEW